MEKKMKCLCGFTWSGLFVLGVALFIEGPSIAQEKKEPWEILIAYDAEAKEETLSRGILLRPNVAQSIFIHLKNTTDKKKSNVEVLLVREGDDQVLAKAFIKDFLGNQTQLVKFQPNPPPAKDGPAPKGVVPPFKYQLWIAEGKNEPVKINMPVTIQQPHEYIKVPPPQFDKKRNRLSVEAQFKLDSDPAEPACLVQLVLNPQVRPGLIKPGQSLLEGKLDAENRAIKLFSENFGFASPPKNGRVYLTVDGYERAFMFRNAFNQGILAELRDKTRLRVKAPSYFNPLAEDKSDPKGEGKKNVLVVAIEADGIADYNKRIEVALDSEGDGNFVRQKILKGLREQIILPPVGLPSGGIRFENKVRDWKLAINVPAGSGKRFLRVRVLGDNDDPVPLADEQNLKEEAVFLFLKDPKQNPYAPLVFKAADNSVVAEITISSSGPEGVKFVGLPPQAAPGDKLVLKATSKKIDEVDPTAMKIQYFLGDPLKEPAVDGVFDSQKQLWQAEVTLPEGAKDKQSVTVQFTTPTGLSASKTETIVVKSGQGKGYKSKITGVVKWDDQIQAGKVVWMRDTKLKVPREEKTNDKGVYVFENVPPGNYQVWSNVSGMFQGTAFAAITKESGETIKADINLKRKP
jgi:hypothetical protein